jgi:hypothetical protein
LNHPAHGFLLEANRVKGYERVVEFFQTNLAPRPKPVVSGG